jgi:hypothetical protein
VFPARVVGWDRVADVVNGGHVPGPVSGGLVENLHGGGATEALRPWQPAVREQLLHLIGRHPLLTVDPLADLLGVTGARVRRLENELLESGSCGESCSMSFRMLQCASARTNGVCWVLSRSRS